MHTSNSVRPNLNFPYPKSNLRSWVRREEDLTHQEYKIKYLDKLGDIEDITCPRVDMNFIFEWSTRYLTSERSERVRYRVDHEKIKFISISEHVMFCLLYKHQ